MPRLTLIPSAAAALAMLAAPAGAVILAVEDFDGTGPAWANNIASQLFEDPSSPGEGLFIQANSGANDAFSGNSLFARDLNGETDEPDLSPFTFTFEDIDTTGFENLSLSFDVAFQVVSDSGSFQVFLNGVGQTPIEFFSEPEAETETVTVSNISVGFSSSNPIESFGLVLTGTLNSADDTFELDNFVLRGDPIPEPASVALVGLGGLALLTRRRCG